jgi:hypothetical protein
MMTELSINNVKWRWFSVLKIVAAWGALIATVVNIIITLVIYYFYPYPYYVTSPPSAPRWMISFRIWTWLVGLIASLVSLPKWQSWVSQLTLILLFFFVVFTAD